jgi:hypothetical protein
MADTLTVTPASGPAGTAVTVQVGLAASVPITITAVTAGGPVSATFDLTDSVESISASPTRTLVPGTNAGEYTFTA